MSDTDEIYEAWEFSDGDVVEISFSTQSGIQDQRTKGLLSPNAKLLHTVRAKTWEEAMTIHHQLMGWEPYKPMVD